MGSKEETGWRRWKIGENGVRSTEMEWREEPRVWEKVEEQGDLQRRAMEMSFAMGRGKNGLGQDPLARFEFLYIGWTRHGSRHEPGGMLGEAPSQRHASQHVLTAMSGSTLSEPACQPACADRHAG